MTDSSGTTTPTSYRLIATADGTTGETRSLRELALDRVEALCDRWLNTPALRRGKAAREVLAAIDDDEVVEDMLLESLGPGPNGTVDLRTRAGGPKGEAVLMAMVENMAAMIDSHHAENYVEFIIGKNGMGTYTCCVRPYSKPTPHELRQQAEAQRDTAYAAIRDTVERLEAANIFSETQDRLRAVLADGAEDQQ